MAISATATGIPRSAPTTPLPGAMNDSTMSGTESGPSAAMLANARVRPPGRLVPSAASRAPGRTTAIVGNLVQEARSTRHVGRGMSPKEIHGCPGPDADGVQAGAQPHEARPGGRPHGTPCQGSGSVRQGPAQELEHEPDAQCNEHGPPALADRGNVSPLPPSAATRPTLPLSASAAS
jgi:hypothetical protein